MTTGAPEEAEVLGWMRRCTSPNRAIEAARHFFPGLSPDDQKVKAQLFRKWWQRAKEAGQVAPPPPPPTAQGTQHAHPMEGTADEPRFDLADLSQIEQLRLLLAEAWADYQGARRRRDQRTATTIRQQIPELERALSDARNRAGKGVKLDRNPAAVAAEALKQLKALQILAGETTEGGA